MPDFEPRRSSVPAFVPPAPSDPDADLDFPAGLATDLPPREGLPPGFRMRADAHYVDQLASRPSAPHVRAIPLQDIDARPAEARDIEPLVRSIGTYGVLQPLLVRSRGSRFALVAGARRLAAAAAAGLSVVPCIVHTCDDQRARALAEAENLHAIPPLGPIAAAPAAAAAGGLKELGQSCGTIESCLHLLAERGGPLRDRVALDLIRTEAHRAGRLVRCLSVLAEEPTLVPVALSIRAALEETIDALGPERRLSGAQIALDVGDGAHMANVDPACFGIALAGALGGMLAIVQEARSPALHVRLATAAAGGSVILEVSQTLVTLPGRALARFFDRDWIERPGGYQAAVELAATRAIARLHRGTADVQGFDRGGCRLTLGVPVLAA